MYRRNRLFAALRRQRQRQEQEQEQEETTPERNAPDDAIPTTPPMSPPPEQSLQGYFPSSVHDVYHAFFVLRQRLPRELAVQILDIAEYWTASRHTQQPDASSSQPDDDALTIRNEPRGAVVVRTPALDGAQSRRVRRVAFRARSHDQGWSDVTADHGTTRAWTWFQGRVEAADGSPAAGPAPDHRYDYSSGVDRVFPRWPAAPPSPMQTWMDARLMTNLCAVRAPSEKTAEWRWDAEDEVEAAAVRALKEGECVALTGHAVFPGWVNHVKRADITVYFGHVR